MSSLTGAAGRTDGLHHAVVGDRPVADGLTHRRHPTTAPRDLRACRTEARPL